MARRMTLMANIHAMCRNCFYGSTTETTTRLCTDYALWAYWYSKRPEAVATAVAKKAE